MEVIFEVSKDFLEVRESKVLGEEGLNVLVEEEQESVGSVIVSKVYTRQEAMNPGKAISCDNNIQ